MNLKKNILLTCQVGDSCSIAGWGNIEYGSGVLSDILMDVEVPIVNYTNCKARYELGVHGKGSVFDRNFCAGAKGKDSCLV